MRSRRSWTIQLAAIREWGLSHIELRAADGVNVSDFSPEKVKEVKAKLAGGGGFRLLHRLALGKISVEEDFAPHLEKVKRTLEIQKELGAPYIRMFSFYMPEGQAPPVSGARCWTGLTAWWRRPPLGTACCSTRTRRASTGTTPPAARSCWRQLAGPPFPGGV